MTKICIRCLRELPFSYFSRYKKSGKLLGTCRTCIAESRREYKKKQIEKSIAEALIEDRVLLPIFTEPIKLPLNIGSGENLLRLYQILEDYICADASGFVQHPLLRDISIRLKNLIDDIFKKARHVIIENSGKKKKCTKCGNFRPLSEFYVRGIRKDGSVAYLSGCIFCNSEHNKNDYYKNQEKRKQYSRDYHAINRDEVLVKKRARYNRNKLKQHD